jgi:hypothetical protein
MTAKRHKTVFKIISQRIKNDLALINHTNSSNTETLSSNNDILDIPELKKSISDIKLLITKQR